VTDDRGFLDVTADVGFLVKLDVTKEGYVHEHAEVSVLKDNFQAATYAFPEGAKSTVLTGWTDATQGYLAVIVNDDESDGGPCATSNGVTVSIKDHPEIKAGYLTNQNTRDATLSGTGSLGLAVLGPIPPGAYEILGTKAGCTSVAEKNDSFQFTSSATILAGALTGTAIGLKAQ
jgi:hypothetical protein